MTTMQSFISIPFKTKKNHGLSDVNGIAKFSGAGIVFEFEAKLFGLISDGVKEARLPIGEILDVKFRKGVFKRGAKIEIRGRSLTGMVGLPTEDGRLTLNLRPEDFDSAREAVDRITRDMTSHEVALPPTHTPVSVLFDPGEDETQELDK